MAVVSERGPRSARKPGSTRSIGATLFMTVFLVYFMIPLFWLVVSSTKTNASLFTSFGFWFSHPFNFINNLKAVFRYEHGVFWDWLGNSALYAVVSAGGAALLATAAGYGLAQYKFRGRHLLFGTILVSIMVPATALAIPTYLLFSKVGLVNTRLAVILPSLVSPFGVYLMRIYAADAVPPSLVESARVDGANEVRILVRIVSRLLAPGFVTVLLFTLVATWNNYFLPLVMLNTPTYFPLTVGLAQEFSAATAGGGATLLYTVVVAGALISIIPLLVAFLFLQRFWQSGLASGAVRE